MAEQQFPINDNRSMLLIPFYSDPESPGHYQKVNQFAEFTSMAKELTGIPLAIVDDGSGLNANRFQEIADYFIANPVNMGKAYAVRRGLRRVLWSPNPPDFIVLYDGDGDQSYGDIPVVHERLLEVSESNSKVPTLVIGDRYSEKLEIEPNPESIEYRQSILTFFGAIAFQLTGVDGIRDWVSGARGLTASFAKELVNKGRSENYGLEAEQLVIAGLVGARVATAPLRISRPRDPNTLQTKWMQNFKVYVDHQDALRRKGKGHVVELVLSLLSKLESSEEVFEIDLEPIGVNALMQFTKQGKAYTAVVPWDYRSTIFESPDSFKLIDQ